MRWRWSYIDHMHLFTFMTVLLAHVFGLTVAITLDAVFGPLNVLVTALAFGSGAVFGTLLGFRIADRLVESSRRADRKEG